jgi:hypothetical protein
MFFLLFLLDDRRIRICISEKWIQMRIREARKHGSYGSGSATLVAILDLGDSQEINYFPFDLGRDTNTWRRHPEPSHH